MLQALSGKYDMISLFTGEDGIKLLMFLVTGKMCLTFPWPGASTAQFIIAVITTLGIMGGIKIKNKLNKLKSS